MLGPIKNYPSLEIGDAMDSMVLWYGMCLIFLLLLIWGLIRKFRSELVPVFNDDDGTVQITPQALRELVRKSCTSIAGVHSPATSIKKQGSKLRLEVQIRVEQNSKVKDTRLLLKQQLESVMVDNLNFSNFGGIDLVIRGFQEEKKDKQSD